MVKDAEAHADEDKKRRESVEVRNQAEALLHSTEKTLEELGDKISDSDKSTIEAASAELKTALEGEDNEAVKEKMDALAQASMKLGEAMYQAAQAEGAAGEDGTSETSGDGSGEDVVDADFEEVIDDKDDGDSKKSA